MLLIQIKVNEYLSPTFALNLQVGHSGIAIAVAKEY